MMESILNENKVTFKSLEVEIYKFICELGVYITRAILEEYDEYLHSTRNRKEYRDKGKRKTTIKTVYGDVSFSRHIFQMRDEYGANRLVYLLDENLKFNRIGLVSENYIELIVSSITEMSYRNCAKIMTENTGLSISHAGVWNIIQALGKKLEEEEKKLAEANKKGQLNGKITVPVLFEEADGVWLNIQGKDRKVRGNTKAEMKAAIAYDGWKNEGSGRYSLSDKIATAGFENSKNFQQTREAMIAKEYNLDEVQLRLINGDGASWIKKTVDKETVFQLDPFHRNKSIRENLSCAKAVKDVKELLESRQIEETFEYLEMYKNGLDDDIEIEKAEKLISYLRANSDGLLPYQARGIKIPESPKGLEYRNMGTMENHIWSIIAKRMKHNHTSWSISGGNHLAKILAKKCCGKLYEVTEKLRIPVFDEEKLEEIKSNVLSSAKIKERIGKGYEYAASGKLAFLQEKRQGDPTAMRIIAGY